MIDSIWTNRPRGHFERPHQVCVVAAAGRGARLFVPRLFDVEQSHNIVIAIACEDAETGAAMVTELEAIRRNPIATPLPALLCLTRSNQEEPASALTRVIEMAPANSYLFITEAVQLDALALSRAAWYRHKSGLEMLQVDLAQAGAAGFRFSFGDYLRYRTYMTNRSADIVSPPPTLSHLLMGPTVARVCATRLADSPPALAWEQIVLVQLLAEYGMPTPSPLLIGYHDRSDMMDVATTETFDFEVEAPALDFATSATRLEHCIRSIAARPLASRLLLGALLCLHVVDYCATLRRADGDGGAQTAINQAVLAQATGLLRGAVDASVGERQAVFGLACVFADQLRLPGLGSLELEYGAAVQRLARVLIDAFAANRFGVAAAELAPLLKALGEIADDTPWSVADDLAWCFFDAVREAEYVEVDEKPTVTLGAEKFTRLEQAMRVHLVRGALVVQRVEELENQLAQAKATLADVYPGRLATLVTEASRGTARDWIRFPLRLARLLWAVFVAERLARYRASRARPGTG